MAAGSIDGLAGVLIWTEADRFPAMARFYRDTLGLTPHSSMPDFINFDGFPLERGRARPGPWGEPRGAPDHAQPDRRRHSRGARAPTRAGWASAASPRRDWGGWVATFADPDGNILQLMQLPA